MKNEPTVGKNLTQAINAQKLLGETDMFPTVTKYRVKPDNVNRDSYSSQLVSNEGLKTVVSAPFPALL